MLKILHTADLHLDENKNERFDALKELVALAGREKVSALVIAGDFFDSEGPAETMRAELREIFDGCGFQTVILPGNHDHKAYRSGLFFGDNLTVIRNWREPFRLGETLFWGLPYEQLGPVDMAARLREMAYLMDPKQENILIYHGELLDTFFSRRDMGAEGDLRYMPARLSFFDPLPVRYILAGHFHSRYTAWQVPGERLFIYPGSPVSITGRETGRRKANLLVPGETSREILLDSFHFEEMVLNIDPFKEQDPLEELEFKLSELHPLAKIILRVEGLYNGDAFRFSETELAAEIRSKTACYRDHEPVLNFIDIRHVIEDDLFKKIRGALEETDHPPEIKKEIEEMVIKAFRGVKPCS